MSEEVIPCKKFKIEETNEEQSSTSGVTSEEQSSTAVTSEEQSLTAAVTSEEHSPIAAVTSEEHSSTAAVTSEEHTEVRNSPAPSGQASNYVGLPQPRPKLVFKNPKYSYIEPGGKKFIWKSLKQIVTQEKALPWPEDVVLYASLNAPPSLKPAKKYSDISGLEAAYTDPQTKLHYHNAEEFRIIRTLPSDIIQGYLALRGATNIVG